MTNSYRLIYSGNEDTAFIQKSGMHNHYINIAILRYDYGFDRIYWYKKPTQSEFDNIAKWFHAYCQSIGLTDYYLTDYVEIKENV